MGTQRSLVLPHSSYEGTLPTSGEGFCNRNECEMLQPSQLYKNEEFGLLICLGGEVKIHSSGQVPIEVWKKIGEHELLLDREYPPYVYQIGKDYFRLQKIDPGFQLYHTYDPRANPIPQDEDEENTFYFIMDDKQKFMKLNGPRFPRKLIPLTWSRNFNDLKLAERETPPKKKPTFSSWIGSIMDRKKI